MATRITVSLREKEHSALAALAQQHDVSLSWLTRNAVAEFLRRYEDDGTQPVLNLQLGKNSGTK